MAATMVFVAFSVLLIVFPLICVNAEDDVFHEELLVKPLPSGHIYNNFQFTTLWKADISDKRAFQHYRLFPKSLGEVLAAYSVQELHLSLTQGLWRYSKWGYPVNDAPPGAQLWVWFQEGTRDVDDTWMELINILSGMFCASLNFMDSKNTVNPKFSFRPEGVTTKSYPWKHNRLLRYAALPREMVCTENLTPWKKLLPCSSKSGLASLFNAIKLYDTSYHSLGLNYRPICMDNNCTSRGVELKQSLAVVLDPTLSSNGMMDWSIKKLYNRLLGTSCPLASTSKILVDISTNKTLQYYFTLSPAPSSVESHVRGGQKVRLAVYNIAEFTVNSRVLNLAAKYNRLLQYKPYVPPVLSAQRFQTGYGQDKGGITCLLYNTHPTDDVTVVYMETVPWFLRIYYHTLDVKYFRSMDGSEQGTILKPSQIRYVPGRDRQQPYHMELVVRLPANSTTRISFQFERALLKWTEYPPDANHGFYVNSAVISTILPTAADYTSPPQNDPRLSAVLTDNSTEFFLRLHTETLLVTLPTPDFSMPYNVICLACTVVAIAFGSIHNLSTRRFVVLDPSQKKGLIAKLKGIFARKKKKVPTATLR